jgi:2-phospho-L-lactate guanylyltransferase (CobY/MobA/RfbA family)
VIALVPMKAFRRAKSRLPLAPRARAQLARDLFEQVLSTLQPKIKQTFVLTECDQVAALARRRGAQPIFCPPNPSLRALVDPFVKGSMLIVMADLPRFDGEALDEILTLSQAHPLVAAPDHHRLGTSALATHHPLATQFGHTDSFARHLALGAAPARAIADLDTAADLAAL